MPGIEAPSRVALVYVMVGVLWIALSDWLILRLLPEYLRVGQTTKGVLFVGLSGALIYALVRRELRKRRQLEAEREDLQIRLAGAQRLEAIGRLTGGIAHDFNNLLTAISGNLESYLSRVGPGADRTLEAGESAAAEDTAELTDAAAAARRAEELTGQLLAFGRRQDLHPQPLDLNAVIVEMVQILHRLIGDHIHVDTRMAEDLWVINVDRGPLQQVVMNLALNARDAMPDGGRLSLSTGNVRITTESAAEDFDFPMEPGEYVRLRVEDTGIGMDLVTRQRIYEPFFTTKEKHLGTGLGMSTVFGIVKQSGGYIALDSAAGEGTRFDLFFPKGKGAVRRAEVEVADVAVDLTGTESVLVVEDEPAVRSVIVRSLERHGFTTIACAAGSDALQVLASDAGPDVDLLITDAVMPGMSGTALIDYARRLRPELPVLLMSGYAEEDLRTEERYLAKPFTTEQLLKQIREALNDNGRSC